MLKDITIQKFYNEDEPLYIDFSSGLTILTGDNGAGKTTILNLVFNILNGDLVLLNDITFKQIVLKLDFPITVNENEEQFVKTIVVNKSFDSLYTKYILNDASSYTISLQKETLNPFIDYNYKLSTIELNDNKQKKIELEKNSNTVFSIGEINTQYQSKINDYAKSEDDFKFFFEDDEEKKDDFKDFFEDDEEKKDDFKDFFEDDIFAPTYESMSELVRQQPSLNFINSLKENIIYFPTYRRIDSDIVHLLEQNYPVNNKKALYEFNSTINNFPNDRRVVGVNDNDIDHLYKGYSEECRKLNSEGLNNVLKSFIEEMILSTYNNKQSTSLEQETPSNLYDIAPEQLIDLSRQLNISNINEEEIKNYFTKQKVIAEYSKDRAKHSKKKKSSIIKSNNKKDYFSHLSEEFLLNSILAVNNNNNLVMRLINLYDQHMKKVNLQLKPYEYLNKCFYNFFKGKINLNLDNYTISLSQPFKDLSTGEKQLITILSYAALSLNTKKYKPLIIIDEPELSLHISWQLNFLNSLLDLPNINVILATHSPYIANRDFEDSIWQLGDIDGY
ncbi:AAA family ATPase [Bacillus cereus]|uniref:AAA family ATPase n=1 Tax=Bacillus cereus TaxID=1396 RepID=UPI002AC2A23B|nr:AAA family ATPase [Bacillus cereus]MDZ4500952.1 AAA family ATPase [Bacillus cereus]